MENGHIGIKKAYVMLKDNLKMENYMEHITGITIVGKNTNKKSLKAAFGTVKVFNGMKMGGNKLRVNILRENDLGNGFSIMKIEV